ncbi:MAG: metallophosphoesterase [Lachnospiraceae bacterium]|nr:metallophosphoesterase [Lachnospiraceae bacterium]
MKVLVMSDSHGFTQPLQVLADYFKGKIDAMIHCGDSEIDLSIIRGLFDCPCYFAEGNCDYFPEDLEREELFELGDHVCYVTHGHRQGVEWGEEELLDRAQELGADLVFYGHTHVPAFHYYEEEGIWIMNPGSVSLPRQNPPERTFLVVDIGDDGEIEPNYYAL